MSAYEQSIFSQASKQIIQHALLTPREARSPRLARKLQRVKDSCIQAIKGERGI